MTRDPTTGRFVRVVGPLRACWTSDYVITQAGMDAAEQLYSEVQRQRLIDEAVRDTIRAMWMTKWGGATFLLHNPSVCRTYIPRIQEAFRRLMEQRG